MGFTKIPSLRTTNEQPTPFSNIMGGFLSSLACLILTVSSFTLINYQECLDSFGPSPPPVPSPAPTSGPTAGPTAIPTASPPEPTDIPTWKPTHGPTHGPTQSPTAMPIATGIPTVSPTHGPTRNPTDSEDPDIDCGSNKRSFTASWSGGQTNAASFACNTGEIVLLNGDCTYQSHNILDCAHNTKPFVQVCCKLDHPNLRGSVLIQNDVGATTTLSMTVSASNDFSVVPNSFTCGSVGSSVSCDLPNGLWGNVVLNFE